MKKKSFGIMLDCSRNAVMKPEKVKEFAKMLADMGYNMLQLYTEDTYEIDGEPFFGYMRGRYTKDELKDIDNYCTTIGIELIPCIQTLRHLTQMAQWPVYRPLFDIQDILMVGDERVYTLIEKMFQTISECFTSRRVNIGMDEAHHLGLGRYLDKHGYRKCTDILLEHLQRVKEIAEKYGFTLMMWSDMFFRPNNNGAYQYPAGEPKLPQEMIDLVPEGVELIYWDYESKDKAHFDMMMDAHAKFTKNPTGFAGGIWIWSSFAPNNRYSIEHIEASMRSALEHSADTVLYTMWGDKGKDCSFYGALPALFAAAQMYQGNFDMVDIAEKFQQKYGYSFQEFVELDLVNQTEEEPSHWHNPCRYLLYNDPFLGLFDYTVPGDLSARYAEAAQKIGASVNGRSYDYIFDFHHKLLKVMVRKCDLGNRIRKAYNSKTYAALQAIVNDDFPALDQDIRAMYEALRIIWNTENKPFGFEVQDQRFGGLLFRLQHCAQRLQAYLDGTVEKIEELEETQLEVHPGFTGHAVFHHDLHGTMITAGQF